jgi:hypothetical protein
MALNYITLVLDLADGTGTPLATGQALLNPSAQLTDATDDMIVTKAQLSAKLAGSYPQARLLATDNTALRLQDGRGRSLSPGRRGTLSRSRSSSRPALTLSPRPAPARPCSLPSAAPMPTARRSCSPGRRRPAGLLARRRLHLAAVEDAEYEPVMLFINHSCEPNVGFAGNTVLVAKRDIGPGEELTTDYALFDEYDGMMQCRCGTPSCRATIGSQDWQRPELQRKYGNYFSSYLLHRLARQPDRPG